MLLFFYRVLKLISLLNIPKLYIYLFIYMNLESMDYMNTERVIVQTTTN